MFIRYINCQYFNQKFYNFICNFKKRILFFKNLSYSKNLWVNHSLWSDGCQLWCKQMFGWRLCLITWLHISLSHITSCNIQHSQHWDWCSHENVCLSRHTLCCWFLSLITSRKNVEWMWNIFNLQNVFKLCIFYKLPSWLWNYYYTSLTISKRQRDVILRWCSWECISMLDAANYLLPPLLHSDLTDNHCAGVIFWQ